MLKIKLLPIVLAAALLTGCNTYEQKKEAAQTRWEKATAKAKVTVAQEFFQNNRYPEAEKTLVDAIESDPQLASAHLLMGKLQFVQAKIDSSKKFFSAAVALDEDMHQGWYFKGLIDQQDKNLEAALVNYKKAMAIQPDNIGYITAVVQMYAAGEDYLSATGLLEKKIQLLPDKSELRLTRAEMLLRLGELKGAIEQYNAVLLFEGDDRSVLESLAYCYIMDNSFQVQPMYLKN